MFFRLIFFELILFILLYVFLRLFIDKKYLGISVKVFLATTTILVLTQTVILIVLSSKLAT